jgi:hypothetical protein
MLKLTQRHSERIRDYIKLFKPNKGELSLIRALSDWDTESLKMILNDNEYNPSLYSNMLNELETIYYEHVILPNKLNY